MPAKTQREREAEQRQAKLERIQEQVDAGSLVIRKMTDAERERFSKHTKRNEADRAQRSQRRRTRAATSRPAAAHPARLNLLGAARSRALGTMSSMESCPTGSPARSACLSTGGGAPHAIPVSTAVRAGPRRVLLALAARRETLARLRREPRCALTIMAAGDVACTVHARAEIVEESLPGAEGVAAVSLEVDAIQDHMQPRFAIAAGVAWDWTDDDARAGDAAVRGALAELARR